MRHFIYVLFSLQLAHAAVTVTVTPTNPSLRTGEKKQFAAKVTGADNKGVAWTVNGTLHGSAAVGTITDGGLYTGPAAAPSPNTVTITATSAADTTAKGSVTVSLLNPVPVIQSLSPSQVNVNLPFTVTIKGTGFLSTSQVMLGDTPLNPGFVSSTQLTLSSTTTAAPGSSLALKVVNPDPGSQTSNARNLAVMAPIKVTISPATTTIRAGDSKPFKASLQNAVDKTVKWYVNTVAGGNATVGTIDANGVYQAPASLPTPGTVTVTAASVADPTASATSTVTLQNPLPVLTGVNPSTANYGPVTLTISGKGFAVGAQVMLGTTALTVSALSPTQITATGTASPVAGGFAPVTVANPAPGPSTSNAVLIALSQANPKISYHAAYRFLEQASFGPDPAGIAHLQQVGFDQWLDEQFSAPPSPYTDPPDTTTGFGPTQSEFFVHAFTGQDQLRQRVAFSLSQIFVISGVKVPRDVALLPYLRVLSNNAFGNYLDVMHDITLNPAMGHYLDMVNNDKFNAKTGVAPNENYARELMQLFTIGTVLLNPDGSPTTTPPTATYDQDTVINMARTFTGWTYPPLPGTATRHHNPENYFSPMVAIDENHDKDPKSLFGQALLAGQTAEQDLNAALQIIFNHPNAGPFVALRLIQHMVKSNPSAAYIGRVSAAFNQSPRGNLTNVVRAILLDPEARQGDENPAGVSDGHLREPVLFMTHFLKALGATAAADNSLTSKGTDMGQQLFDSPSVFNYYSPFFRTAGGALLGPEFQLMNPSSAINRANFIYSAATNRLGKSVTFDISPFAALAQQPDSLLDALNAALMHGQMPSDMRASILNALAAVKDPKLRAQYAIFLVGSSSQYQVEE